jgi:phage-related protein
MAGTFPVLSSGCVAMLPLTKRRRAPIGSMTFGDRSQQIFADGPQINSWDLQYNDLSYTDLAILRDFFDLQKGAFDKTWTFPIDATNFANCTFIGDVFDYTEDSPLRFRVSLSLRQVRSAGMPASPPASFPSIKPGVVTQLPFGTRHFYETVSVEMPSGQKYSASTITNPMRTWSLAFPVLTRAEANALLGFFAATWGRLKTFEWTDPQTTEVFPRVRFAQDEIAIEHRTPNTVSTSLLVEEQP